MVRNGSLAEASAKASLASSGVTPSISKMILPGWISLTKYSGLPLPLPMRTSAGFCDTGLSGKTRIQMRPPRLMWRDMARRPASSWRAVRRPRVVALRPYSPKETLAPRVATPVLRPFCCFLYLVRAGCSIALFLLFAFRLLDLLRLLHRGLRSRGAFLPRCRGARARGSAALASLAARARRGFLRALRLGRRLGLRRRRCGSGYGRGCMALRQHLALVDPDLDADHAVGGLRLAQTVIDVGAQRVQRYAAFAIPLGARDLDAVQAAGAHDLDALGAQPHGVLHRALHRAAEHDALLELLRDRVGDQLRVDLGLADLLDVHVHLLHAHDAAQLGLERLDLLALLADHHARPRREDGDARVLGGALDQHAADRGVRQLLLEEVAHLDVLGQHRREVAAVRVPLRAPVAVDREPEADRIDLLTHKFFQSPTVMKMWQVCLVT